MNFLKTRLKINDIFRKIILSEVVYFKISCTFAARILALRIRYNVVY
jgi:hypothetical protein